MGHLGPLHVSPQAHLSLSHPPSPPQVRSVVRSAVDLAVAAASMRQFNSRGAAAGFVFRVDRQYGKEGEISEKIFLLRHLDNTA